jgi:hypothetical protein
MRPRSCSTRISQAGLSRREQTANPKQVNLPGAAIPRVGRNADAPISQRRAKHLSGRLKASASTPGLLHKPKPTLHGRCNTSHYPLICGRPKPPVESGILDLQPIADSLARIGGAESPRIRAPAFPTSVAITVRQNLSGLLDTRRRRAGSRPIRAYGPSDPIRARDGAWSSCAASVR